jgi:N-methylhydantoinase A
VCYGLGGTEPTLTDACAVLGYLDPQGLAGGEVPLDLDSPLSALQPIADKLKMRLPELAHGVYLIAVSNMCRAIRAISTERGKDPRDFVLIAFGGNGGLFGAAVARELELPRVVVPPAAGIFSAFGLLYSDLEHHFTQTLLGRVDRTDAAAAEALWQRLEGEARRVLAREGYGAGRIKLQRFAELRYLSQSHELSVPWQPTLQQVAARFEEEHERTYGHRGHDGIVELVNLHLVASGLSDQPRVPATLEYRGRLSRKATERKLYFGREWHTAKVLTRDAVRKLQGPAVIHEFDTSVLVPPGFSAALDSHSNLVLTPS